MVKRLDVQSVGGEGSGHFPGGTLIKNFKVVAFACVSGP